MAIQIDPIIPIQLISRDIGSEIIKEVTKEVILETEEFEKLFGKATRTWSSENTPKWNKSIGFQGPDLVGKTTTGAKVFSYVELGTSERWRKMSRNFRRKTTPGVLGSGPGRGGAVGWFPRPVAGLKARNFRLIIAEQEQEKFPVKIQVAVSRAVSRFT